MNIIECGQRITLLGDPHLGRSFVNGVPLHRRGDRERMVWADFVRSLRGSDPAVDLHVCLGDLFDRWIVPFDLILDVAAEYRAAASERPATRFVVLRGNHDWTRDLTRRSAFDVFAALVANVANITVVTDVVEIDGLVFYPWHPLWDARDKLQDCRARILFGHFDVAFGEHNLVPTTLSFERIYTGHDHKARRLMRHGTEVIVVGSMQPYAHGEEADDSLYVTLTAEDVQGDGITRDLRNRCDLSNRCDLRNKCVRIVGPFDGDIDCLQLTLTSDRTEVDGTLTESVTLGAFDMEALFAQVFTEAGVSPDRTAQVLAQYQSRRNAEGG